MRVQLRPPRWLGVLLALALISHGTAASAIPRAAQPASTVTGFHTAADEDRDDADSSKNSSDTAVDSTLQLVVAPLNPVLQASDTEAKFRVLVRNTGKRAVAEGSVELRIGERLLSGSVSTPPAVQGSAGTIIATEQLKSVAAGKELEVTVTVPITELPLTSTSDQGVYPLVASYLPGDLTAAAITAFSPVVWGGTAGASDSVAVTLVVPFVLPAKISDMPSQEQLAELAPGYTALLEYANRTRSVTALDPRLVAAIRAYGNETPQAARELLSGLERTTLTSFMLQYGDADPASQAALGAETLLTPLGFEFVTRLGQWDEQQPGETVTPPAPDGGDAGVGSDPASDTAAPQDPAPDSTAPGSTAPGSTAQPQNTPDTPAETQTKPRPKQPKQRAQPTLAELSAWPGGVAASWPAPGQVNEATLSLVRNAGLDLTVLRSDNVTLTGGPRAVLDAAAATGTAIITDAELDAGVALALAAPSDTERELGTAQSTARMVLAAGEGISGLVLGVDRGGIAEAENPVQLLQDLMSRQWITQVSLTEQQEGTARLVEADPGEERTALLEEAVANEAYVLEARAVLVNPEYLDGYQRIRLLTLFATRHSETEKNFATVAKRFQKRDGELRDGVRIVGANHAQLVGGSSRVPIQLRNSLPFDAIVNLRVSPVSAALAVSESDFPGITLAENSSERVLVPLKSRVSSGESGLLLTVTSTDRGFTASSSALSISISTTVEVVVLSLLVLTALALFGFGIWRSVRRRRAMVAGE